MLIFDGTKETTIDYFNDLLDNEKLTQYLILKLKNNKKWKNWFIRSSYFKRNNSNKNAIVAIGKMGKTK